MKKFFLIALALALALASAQAADAAPRTRAGGRAGVNVNRARIGNFRSRAVLGRGAFRFLPSLAPTFFGANAAYGAALAPAVASSTVVTRTVTLNNATFAPLAADAAPVVVQTFADGTALLDDGSVIDAAGNVVVPAAGVAFANGAFVGRNVVGRRFVARGVRGVGVGRLTLGQRAFLTRARRAALVRGRAAVRGRGAAVRGRGALRGRGVGRGRLGRGMRPAMRGGRGMRVAPMRRR